MMRLSKRWAVLLRAQPETGMGFQIATVKLLDGREFQRVRIVEGQITAVGGSTNVPFSDADIADIVVDHGIP
jgi:hypothetical protein